MIEKDLSGVSSPCCSAFSKFQLVLQVSAALSALCSQVSAEGSNNAGNKQAAESRRRVKEELGKLVGRLQEGNSSQTF